MKASTLRFVPVGLYPVELHRQVMERERFDLVIETMLREGVVKSKARALDLISALVQWLCVGTAALTHNNFVMLRGPVDDTFHTLIIHTRFYASFCDRYFGRFVHHDPFTKQLAEEAVKNGAIDNTLRLLQDGFGKDLHPELRKWVALVRSGRFVVTMVSCPGNDLEG